MESGDKILGIGAALGSAASWAIGAILFKRLGECMSSFGMTLAKGAVSLVLLGSAVMIVGFEAIDARTAGILVASGLIGIALGDSFFFKALQDLGPVSMIILMVVGQVLTIFMALIFLKEMPSAMEWTGIACILAGVTITLSAELSGERKASGKRGLIFGLLSVLCMAVSIVIAKAPLDSMPSLQATFVRMGAGTVGVFVAGMMFGQVGGWVAPLKDGSFLAHFLLAVGVVTFGGFWLSMYAIKHLDVAVANTLNSTEPIFVLPLAYFVLGERITVRAIAGAASAFAGVALISLSTPIQPPN